MKHTVRILFLLLALLLSLTVLVGCEMLGFSGNSSRNGTATDPAGNSTESAEPDSVSVYVNGELYQTIRIQPGKTYSLPALTADPGYRIDAWYADADCTIPYTNGSTAYARFVAIPYTVTVHLTSDAEPTVHTYTVESADYELETPNRPGYTFLGWKKDDAGETSPLYATVTIPKGSSGNLSFTAAWEPTVYKISYDYNGGAGNNPESYTVETDTFSLQKPERLGYFFAGWEFDGQLLDEVTVPKGSSGELSFRALWKTTFYTFSATANPASIPVTVRLGSETLSVDTPIRVTAPVFSGDLQFVGWQKKNAVISSSPVYELRMPAENTELIALYREIPVVSYDRASGTALQVAMPDNSAPTAISGGGLRTLSEAVFADGKVTLPASYLASLAPGDYRYYVASDSSETYLTIRVTDSSRLYDLSLSYDCNRFPDAELHFGCSCGGTHSYSLDSADRISCQSGSTIPSFDKTRNHTLTVFCGDGSGSATLQIKAYDPDAAEFFTETFTYGGKTYDYAASTVEEFYVIAEYAALVDCVLKQKADPTAAEVSFRFWAYGDLLAMLRDEAVRPGLIQTAFTQVSLPMSPTYKTSLSGTDSGMTVTLTFSYGNGLNSEKSKQDKTVIGDRQGFLPASGRASDFEAFPIDALSGTLTVRTLYELERLPYGCKPLFAATAGDAQEVYLAARAILRSIIDDRMDDYAKVTAIYAWLGENVTYDDHAAYHSSNSSKYDSFTVYGALIDRAAVCDGFASAFRLLCQIEGIRSEEYTGLNRLGDTSSGHAWNKVWIGGAVFGVDSTWARQGSGDTLHVATQYLFMDEATLIATKHYENAWYDDRFTSVCADARVDLLLATETEAGYDLVVDSQAEMNALLRWAKNSGLTFVEFRLDSGMTTACFQTAVNKTGVSGQFYSSPDSGYCYLVL